MSVFFKAVAGKVIPLIVSFIVFLTGGSFMSAVGDSVKSASLGVAACTAQTAQSEEKKTEGDTVKTDRETRKSKREKLETQKAVSDEDEKSVKISITDKGIKVGTGDSEEEILRLDAERIKESIGEAIEGLEAQLGDLDTEFDLDGLSKREFHTVRNSEIVKIGEDIHVRPDELIRGDVVAILGDVEIEGKVTGNVVSIIGDVDLGPTAIVNGEVVCVIGVLSEDDGSRVRGQITDIGGYDFKCPGLPFFSFGSDLFRIIARLVMFIVGLLLFLMIIYFVPARMKNSADYVFGSFFKSIGTGILVILLGSIVVAILMVILAITIIGIPVAILLGLSFIALIILGYFVGALALGRAIVRKFNMGSDSLFMHGFTGLLILSVLSLLASLLWFSPVLAPAKFMLKTLGGFLNFLAIFTGTGAFILSKGGAIVRKARPQIPETPGEG